MIHILCVDCKFTRASSSTRTCVSCAGSHEQALVHVLPCGLQVHTSKLDADSFWVKANEEKFAKDEIFAGLIENFASKAPGSYALVRDRVAGVIVGVQVGL